MKVLITGGAGLVGSHCAEYFAKKGNQIVVLDNLMRSNLFGYDRQSVEYNWNYLAKYKNIKRIKGDVRNEEDIFKAIGEGVDAVIHTAGQPGVPLSVKIPKEDFDINAFGTLNVLECFRQKCPTAAFIYTSTNKVYGENVDRIVLTEKETHYIYEGTKGVSEKMFTDLTGHTPYGVSKLVGDLYTQEYAHIYGMKTAVFRMSCIYGTRQFGFEDQDWVAWFIVANLLNKPLTILEFLGEVEKLSGRKTKPAFSEWRPSDQKVYISDITKVKKELNWQPEVGVSEGIKRLLEWIKENEGYFS